MLRIPSVLGAAQLAELRTRLSAATFEDGGATAGPVARAVKRNLQVPQDSEAARACAAAVLAALQANPLFYAATLPKRLFGPLFNRYDAGMAYGEHIDNAVMGNAGQVRGDVAATLFLSDPAEYDGGELVVRDGYGAHRIKLEAGSMVVYPGGSPHRVEPVTRGTRYAAVLWAQSLVKDEARRRLLFEMDLALGALRQKPGVAAEADALTATYHNLLRMWAEP